MPAITVPPVGQALLVFKDLAARVRERLHDQEHCWEDKGYRKLECWWNKLNDKVWKWHHKALKRAFTVDVPPVSVTGDEVAAYQAAIDALDQLHAQCQKIYATAEAEGDYVTSGLSYEVQESIEEWLQDARARLAQAKRLKDQYMAEQL
jgi:hypothetical protein